MRKRKDLIQNRILERDLSVLVTECLCNINHSSQNILFNQVEFEFYIYMCFPVANGPKSGTQQGYCFLFDQILLKFLSPVVFRSPLILWLFQSTLWCRGNISLHVYLCNHFDLDIDIDFI